MASPGNRHCANCIGTLISQRVACRRKLNQRDFLTTSRRRDVIAIVRISKDFSSTLVLMSVTVTVSKAVLR